MVIVDPAMADNGKLYAAFDEAFPAEMAKVCAKADVILPNMTEASLLTGLPYKTEQDPAYIRQLLEALLELGCGTAVLTGVSYEPGKLGVAALDRDGNEFSYFTRRCEQSYHGTGDIFFFYCRRGDYAGNETERCSGSGCRLCGAAALRQRLLLTVPDGMGQNLNPRFPGCAGSWRNG